MDVSTLPGSSPEYVILGTRGGTLSQVLAIAVQEATTGRRYYGPEAVADTLVMPHVGRVEPVTLRCPVAR